MIDNGSRVSDSLLSRRIRQMVALDPGATALSFDGLTFPWSFYSDAVTDLGRCSPAHPGPGGSGSCCATGPARSRR